MEVQAYIEINERRWFSIGLVTGQIDGSEKINQVRAFTWEGGDENDEASGIGWLKDKNTLEGRSNSTEETVLTAKRA